MERYVDLHVHTNYSDGSFAPKELVKRAKECGITAIAISDHDEVGGISEAIWAGHSEGVEIVPAVEITSSCNGKEIHLLGYLIDHNSVRLREDLKLFRYQRFQRMEKMLARLKDLGLKINMETIRRISGHGSLGRLHLARALFQQGMVDTVQEAFDRYIGKGRPAFVKRPRLEAADAFELIRSAGGLPVLAHPKLAKIDKHIPHLTSLGLRGVEVYYAKHTPEDQEKYLNIAKRNSLLITGGSDCHGEIKDKMLIGSIKLPYKYLTVLREEAALLSS